MFSTPLEKVGMPRGAYSERRQPGDGPIEQFCARLVGPAARRLHIRQLELKTFAQQVSVQGDVVKNLDGRRLLEFAGALRLRLRQQGINPEDAAQTFALVREAATVTLGKRHFDVQIMGGWIVLNGMIAEMDTGEGKTLTATLPACTAALAGMPVHIVTVNDYLAKRDAGLMKPVYEALGLSVGAVTHGLHSAARRQAYACDVTYCTNKELVFDYLRDRIALGQKTSRIQLQIERLGGPSSRLSRLLLRGLHFAIVDEADSVLIDEARTPLIISQGSEAMLDRRVYQATLSLAAELEHGKDFVIEERGRVIRLTDAGRARIVENDRSCEEWGIGALHREEIYCQALTAQHLMQRDTHYVVKDNKVQIVDEYTGRVMADRSWEHGLHQFIEAKEGCDITSRRDPISRISYQRFFRRYRRLAGMTGTAREVRGELWSVYRLAVVPVPTNQPSRRRHTGDQVYETAAQKWQAVGRRTAELHNDKRPILIGTRSVAASEHLSRLLSAAAIPHCVLNARQDEEEASIIAQAGEAGRITVATNMAGRGTDIRLAPGVAERGGLHVIGTEYHQAGRIDRQLHGRCARQGDPGSYEMIVSLEDELVTVHGGLWKLLGGRLNRYGAVGPWLGKAALWWAQLAAERLHSRIRRDLLKADARLETALAFAGRFE
jgi:preprotein translocase subunit SecA